MRGRGALSLANIINALKLSVYHSVIIVSAIGPFGFFPPKAINWLRRLKLLWDSNEKLRYIALPK